MSDSYTNTNTRTDTLNQGAAHDTGIYDPNIHDNQIVAMYETEDRARAARDTLIANGVPERAIHVTDREQDSFAGGVDYERNDAGLWGAIKSLFMPDEEAHGYAEGVRRGHAILVVQPDGTMDRQRVIEVLEGTDPVDFDAKLEEWRQAGYSYPGAAGAGAVAAGATGAAMGTPTIGVVSSTSAMRATDTTAAGTFRDAPTSSAAENDYIKGESASNVPGGAYEARGEAASGGISGRSNSMSGAQVGTTVTPPAKATTLSDSVQGSRATTGATPAGQDETIKVIEERLRVGKREVIKGAVRVRSYMVERPVEQQVRLHEERVEVDRRPVDRPITGSGDALFQERVIEARASGEEAVVGKEARVVEEVALRKEAADRTETVRDTVRKTEVEVEGDPNATAGFSPVSRTDSTTTTSSTGVTSSGMSVPRK